MWSVLLRASLQIISASLLSQHKGPPVLPFGKVQFHVKPTGLTDVKLVAYCSL